MKVADAMVTKSYDDGEMILKQGDPADYFYIVIDGKVTVKRRGDDQVFGQLLLRVLHLDFVERLSQLSLLKRRVSSTHGCILITFYALPFSVLKSC